MSTKKANNLSWGVTLLVFGCLFMIKQLQLLPPEISIYVFDYKNYPLIVGLIFLLFHNNKNIGIVLIVVGLLLRLSDIIEITKHISDYIWPALLIIAGAILIFRKK
jgi:hypothetical protein